ncbi:MAG: ROK family protein [Prevotella sp.]|jgi:glucokinase
MDKNYVKDERVVMTLDAGGTNFVFSAIRGGIQVTPPYHLPAVTDDLEGCLHQLVEGFRYVKSHCPAAPSAISFAFPGPADYVHGVIGNLPNFECFQGGVAMGGFLEEEFGIPVFINNDGGLFAYGEAMAGGLPTVNKWLAKRGSNTVYRNLVGITLGTGFGCGIVINNQLLLGDNGQAGNIWCFRNKKHPQLIAEESVSIRAVCRVYHESCDDPRELTPKDIADIAHGKAEGNREAALRSFKELGEVAGDAIAMTCGIVDGIVVIGGGLARSSDLIFPSMVSEMNSTLGMSGQRSVNRLPVKVYNLDTADGLEAFLNEEITTVNIPGTDKQVPYRVAGHIGVMRSPLGASNAITHGAYLYALAQLDANTE